MLQNRPLQAADSSIFRSSWTHVAFSIKSPGKSDQGASIEFWKEIFCWFSKIPTKKGEKSIIHLSVLCGRVNSWQFYIYIMQDRSVVDWSKFLETKRFLCWQDQTRCYAAGGFSICSVLTQICYFSIWKYNWLWKYCQCIIRQQIIWTVKVCTRSCGRYSRGVGG